MLQENYEMKSCFATTPKYRNIFLSQIQFIIFTGSICDPALTETCEWTTFMLH